MNKAIVCVRQSMELVPVDDLLPLDDISQVMTEWPDSCCTRNETVRFLRPRNSDYLESEPRCKLPEPDVLFDVINEKLPNLQAINFTGTNVDPKLIVRLVVELREQCPLMNIDGCENCDDILCEIEQSSLNSKADEELFKR